MSVSQLERKFVINHVKIFPYKWKILKSHLVTPASKLTNTSEAAITSSSGPCTFLGLARAAPSHLPCQDRFQIPEPQWCLSYLPLLGMLCAPTEMFCPKEWLEALQHVGARLDLSLC